MALSEEKVKGYVKRLLISRMRILCNHGFLGLLLMHMKFSVDEDVPTAYTDGVRIVFGTDFLDNLSDSELDYVMMHEILHVVLQHCTRGTKFEPERYNIAADIVVNSNILLENNMNLNSITLSGYGVSVHITPNGKEGHEYTAEQVYEMVKQPKYANAIQMSGSSGGKGNGEGDGKGNGKGNGEGNGKGNGEGNGKGNGEENTDKSDGDGSGFAKGRADKKKGKAQTAGVWDDHSKWSEFEKDESLRDVWVKRFEDAAEAIAIKDPSNSRGTMPAFAKRMLEELMKPQTDWRTVLNEFIQEEINDYSFSPPDRRFDDSPFFLPDFNEKDEKIEKILFMIDTSGSMSDKMITAAYSEVKGAIDQFNGKLEGWLGFFDAAIIEPRPFTNEEEFRVIRPAGGGGTDFQIILEYVHEYMKEDLPVSIIILTDGFAPFPQEHLAGGIPVLWLLNNEDVNPPWGKIARIKV